MAYSLYKLKFSTGLHIGKHVGGSSLDDGSMTIHSDTLFSALCCESTKSNRIKEIYDCFEKNRLIISDALPFYKDDLFLPKPILFMPNSKQENSSAIKKKKLKDIEYLPLSKFNAYLQGFSEDIIDPDSIEYEFGTMVVETKNAIKGYSEAMPYNLAYWRFNQDSGLYIIVKYEDKQALSIFEDCLWDLGLSGIGGKQSSGFGKFSVEKFTVPKLLLSLLNKEKADYQMLLGIGLPEDRELDKMLEDGWYRVLRRGGFIRSETYAQTPMKKRTIFALSSGSCLKERFDGVILDLSNEGGAHPVWRCCKTLFVGVSL
ncbi:MAG: type III-A CRISPR-associated RAMP protein Csm4 [Caldicoprobacterales bacterium]|jgi:CRISPR-associated protein Csm4|nr:type III-A CRISPR-associated RAMP protein Csm4 [Clostridiales bacterium]